MTDEQAMTDAKALAGSHYTCEDCWYSCPASGQCCNDNLGDECNCGYDTRVKFIAAALATRERAVWREVEAWCEKEVEHWNPAPECAAELPRQQARAQEATEIAAWCRQQAQAVKP